MYPLPCDQLRRMVLVSSLAAVLATAVPGRSFAADVATPTRKPKVEVVFCLDTTGSMGGLIEGAKQKIWSISNQIASGRPVPELKIGLVAFRDKGDEYITKVIDLTDDLDAIHAQLRTFQAAGGGDEPESVNQALHDAVHKIKWSTDRKTLRMIYLVGDAPPHMDYPDDVKYPLTCKAAVEKGITINTIQCGASPQTRKYWQDICSKSEGAYVQIAQDGGVAAVATPFDKRLSEINSEMSKTTLPFGDRAMQAAGEAKKAAARDLAAPAGADRAAFNAKLGRVATYDLLDGIKEGRVKLESLKQEELPAELQGLSLGEQRQHLEKLSQRRSDLGKEAVELDKKRNDFIAKKLSETKNQGKDAFDSQVLEILRKQAKRYEIDY
jgi:Mg-chelatase subunit ChlD